jgi:hypothetical protein
MGNYQGIGEVTQFGQHLATVRYSIETELLEGEIDIDKGEQYLSRHDRFTLHMQGGMGLVFRVTQVSDGVMGKYRIKGIGDLGKSS